MAEAKESEYSMRGLDLLIHPGDVIQNSSGLAISLRADPKTTGETHYFYTVLTDGEARQASKEEIGLLEKDDWKLVGRLARYQLSTPEKPVRRPVKGWKKDVTGWCILTVGPFKACVSGQGWWETSIISLNHIVFAKGFADGAVAGQLAAEDTLRVICQTVERVLDDKE